MAFFSKQSGIKWIIAFLGNPGPRYNNTRHNVGFMAGDIFAGRFGVRINKLKFKALTAICKVSSEKALLIKPQTFMNLSGESVREAMAFHKVPTDRIIVIADDAALPAGKLRIRQSGSSGGHNGLKSIIAKCGGEGFPRVKIGVGSPENPEMDLADWVLQTLSGRELDEMRSACGRACDAVECIISDGIEKAMNKFNKTDSHYQ